VAKKQPATLSTRVGKLEQSEQRAWNAIERLADRQTALDGALETLIEAQTKTEERFQKTDARLEKLAEEGKEREKRLDERIEKLVSAIGVWISRTSNGKSDIKPE
jgi:chromosome segregation ATPase